MIAFALLLVAADPDCENTVIQSEITDCALSEFREADAKLNRQWALTLAAMRAFDREWGSRPEGKTREQALLDAQRAWIKFRDAHCDSAYPYSSGAQLDYTQNVWCHRSLTEERTQQLAHIAEAP